ncbi:alanine racemase [Microbulbifer sp. 2205BS26-8]|uniref:alanine racemase n=1 Tax=Microbulbifer sp. 2205BS26-8 TaxID=3064386 RepID=UPI00273DC7B4|nr:alanine racemase [Microbulbifer sp. 2205BS26-8]MDP5208381.1 alanine racemase [Microbulbifer sp. 2205BS26-8]
MTDSREGLLSINLQSIADNYQDLVTRVAGGARCGAVVKADAYGLGMSHVAPTLYRQGCRDFFVATQAEGESLRDALGDDVPIVILTGVRAGAELECARAGLMPTLFTLEQLRHWVGTCARAGLEAPCAVKVDSGMTRLGLSAEEFEHLLRDRELLRLADIRILLSHLACADEPQHAQNIQQLRSFKEAGQRLRTLCPNIQLSLANSSGIFLGKDYHFDIVRPGSALYGINPVPGIPNPMRSTVTLSLPIVQKRHLSQEQSVGYGATQRMAAGSWLAVARGGYADGIMRAQGGRGHGWACGRKLPIVGRISMDSTTFDISALSAKERESLQSIEILNQDLTVDEVAQYADTIGYEVLTSLGHRYFRRYI